jgi:hypothetical protein
MLSGTAILLQRTIYADQSAIYCNAQITLINQQFCCNTTIFADQSAIFVATHNLR